MFEVKYSLPLITNELKTKGDFFVKLMRGQLKTFLKRPIETEAKRNHLAIQLALKSLAIISAFMIVLDCVESELTSLDDTISLLYPNTDYFLLCTTFPQHNHAHFICDTNLGAFVRNGKVIGQGFTAMHKEHKKKSKEKNSSSKT